MSTATTLFRNRYLEHSGPRGTARALVYLLKVGEFGLFWAALVAGLGIATTQTFVSRIGRDLANGVVNTVTSLFSGWSSLDVYNVDLHQALLDAESLQLAGNIKMSYFSKEGLAARHSKKGKKKSGRAMVRQASSSLAAGGSGRAFRPGFDRTSSLYRYGELNDMIAASELKFLLEVHATAGINLSTTPQALAVLNPDQSALSTVSLLEIAQGTTESQRVGRNVYVYGIEYKFQVVVEDGTSTTRTDIPNSTNVEFWVVLDTQTNGAAMTGVDAVGGTLGFPEPTEFGRYQILWNKKMLMKGIVTEDGAATTEYHIYRNSSPVCTGMLDFSSSPIKIEYNSTNGTIAEMRTNNIMIFGQARHAGVDFTVGTSAIATKMEGSWRVWFKG